jgi:hypothetical protein
MNYPLKKTFDMRPVAHSGYRPFADVKLRIARFYLQSVFMFHLVLVVLGDHCTVQQLPPRVCN